MIVNFGKVYRGRNSARTFSASNVVCGKLFELAIGNEPTIFKSLYLSPEAQDYLQFVK